MPLDCPLDPSHDSIHGSSSSPLFQCIFDNEKTTLINWNSYKLNHCNQPIDLYIQFINSLSKCGRQCIKLTNRSVVIQSRDEMRMACAFVLASNNRWHFKCAQGKVHLMTGLKGDVDESMLLDIQKWYNSQADELTYEFLLRGKRLPETFTEHIIKPYLKTIGIPNNDSPIPNHLCNEKRQHFFSSPITKKSFTESSDEQYMPSEPILSHSDPLANNTTIHADTAWLDDESHELDDRIDNALTEFNIKETSRKPIENSITAKRLMAVKHALLNRNQSDDKHESPVSTANAVASSDTSLTVETQTDSRSLPPTIADSHVLPQQAACATLEQVSTEAFLNDADRQYMFQKALKTRHNLLKKSRQFLDVVTQWVCRNKRCIIFQLTELGAGLAVNIILASLISLSIGSTIIISSFFILTLASAIIFWFTVDNIIYFVKTKWHHHRSEKLRKQIRKLEENIDIYCEKIKTIRTQLQSKTIKPDMAQKLEVVLTENLALLQQSEITLKQHKHKLLKSLMFLSGEVNITDALIKERREFDAIAKKISKLKHAASDSFEDAVLYETAMAELKYQQTCLKDAMKPVTESIILALEVYTQDKASIEKDISTLLESGTGKLNLFEDMNNEELGQIFSTIIDKKGKKSSHLTLHKIRSFLCKPSLIETMITHDVKKSMYNKHKLLGLQCEIASQIGPENYTETEIEDNLVYWNPNMYVANLMSRAQAGIQTKQVLDEQVKKLETQAVKQVIKGVSKSIVAYVVFQLQRIPYQLYQAGTIMALLSGIRPSAKKLFGAALSGSSTAGIFGIVTWACVSRVSRIFNTWNNQVNQAITAVRENHMTNYSDPYPLKNIPDWMALKESSTRDHQGHSIVRTREQMGYFNTGVLDDNLAQSLTENEWRSLRRQAKYAFGDATALINEFQEVKSKLSTLTNQLSQEHLAAKNEGRQMVHNNASREEVARLLLSYNLLVQRIQQTIKTIQQANYECVRHVNRINQRLKIKHSPEQPLRHVTVS